MGVDTGNGRRVTRWRPGLFIAIGFLSLFSAIRHEGVTAATDGITSVPTQDTAPTVVSTSPVDGASQVARDIVPSVTFSEPVSLDPLAITLVCSASGTHGLTLADGPEIYRLLTTKAFIQGETCAITIRGEYVHDRDSDDPPDVMLSDRVVSFTMISAQVDDMLINEVDAVTTDGRNEFIELFDGGAGETDLTGLVIVLFGGTTDKSYLTINLAGHTTDNSGYFVLANGDLPASVRLADDVLRDGPDAIALYAASPNSFPIGTPVTTDGLLDAIVYDSGQPDDNGLLPLLDSGQPQVNEAGRGKANQDASQRCPNGAGGKRITTAYVQNTPSPGATNACVIDTAPAVLSVLPANNDTGVLPDTELRVTFNEPVDVADGWFELVCETGKIAYTVAEGPAEYLIKPEAPLPGGNLCRATILATRVSDQDALDPPDLIASDFTWSFHVQAVVARDILINEIDSDTQGADTAEFVELYDGGDGNTDLTGLALVLYNGGNDSSYRAIDLAGHQTDAGGYFVIGSAEVSAGIVMPPAWLQNGTDAVALYAAPAAEYPTGSPITLDDLVDAVVYSGDGLPSGTMLSLLLAGDTPVDEDAGNLAEADSSQRCPDGAGGARRTLAFGIGAPTPASGNKCHPAEQDEPPTVVTVLPANGATNVALSTTLSVTFSEPVEVEGEWLRLDCDEGGSTLMMFSGGPVTYTATPTNTLQPSDRCTGTVVRRKVTDLDSQDPPDQMESNYSWTFQTADRPPLGFATISEFDSDTPGTDKAEFIELFDGGGGFEALDGLTLVLYNGSTSKSYAAISLDGHSTEASGYFVVGNTAVSGTDLIMPDGLLQNGPDAIALYGAPAAQFPNGTPVTTADLIDAVVYGPANDLASGLLPLLLSGQGQADEAAGQDRTAHSLQRCPDAAPPRRTDALRATIPTPGAANDCVADLAPSVVSVLPQPGSSNVSTTTVLTVLFSEPVTTSQTAFNLDCTRSGAVALSVSRPDQTTAQLAPAGVLEPGEACTATVRASQVRDIDSDDPPDTMSGDYAWTFNTAVEADRSILINELDADTPGTDTAEFVELYDGGRGNQSLEGLVLVFYNGATDTSYRTVDLTGQTTNSDGYFVVGSSELAAADISLPASSIQNGADAVALYAGNKEDYPNGTPLSIAELVDALVYDTDDDDDPELLALLQSGQPQINEAGRGDKDSHSSQRCPDGTGGPRQTQTFAQSVPTPGEPNTCVLDSAPVVLQTVPASGEAGVALDAVLTVTFSEPVTAAAPWLTLTCAQTGDHGLTVTGGPVSYRLVPDRSFASGERCQATLNAGVISDVDSDDPPDHPDGDYTWAFTTEAAICGEPSLPIAAIQGTGLESSLVGAEATIEGIVAGSLLDGDLLYAIQTPESQIDGDSMTSDAMFAVAPSGTAELALGDHVRLSGVVAEQNGRTTLVDTTLLATCAASVDHNPLPLTLPQTGDQIGWEHTEAMLVSLAGPLTVIENSYFGEQGRVTLSVNGRMHYPTQSMAPGAAAQEAKVNATSYQMLLDDGVVGLPSTWSLLSPERTVRAGDWLDGVAGVVDPGDDILYLHSQTTPLFRTANPRPDSPPRTSSGLRILSVEMDGLVIPATGQDISYQRKRDKLVNTIVSGDADIVSLLNLGGNWSQRSATLSDLLDALEAMIPEVDFATVQVTADPEEARPAAAFLYRATSVAAIGHSAVPPANLIPDTATLPVAQQFSVTSSGEPLLVVATSYPDRTDCPTDDPPNEDNADGQQCNNARRVALSEGINRWLITGPSGRSSSDILLVGQFHALRQEDPVQALLEAGWIDMHADQLEETRYSDIVDGLYGQTHYILGSQAVAGKSGGTIIWHTNADEPAAFDYRDTNPPALYSPDPYRSSTTDPLVIDLQIDQLEPDFISNSPITIGETAIFTSTNAASNALAFQWDLGDETAGRTGRTINHLYTQPGVYTVTLTVVGPSGERSASQLFVVRPHRAYLPISAREIASQPTDSGNSPLRRLYEGHTEVGRR